MRRDQGLPEQPEQKTALQQFMDTAKAARDAVMDAPGIRHAREISDSKGAAPLHAFIRQGADELAAALPAFPDSNIRPQAEPGQLFEPTPQMVTEQITGRQVNLEMDR